MIKYYLFLYNFAQFIGWSYLLFLLVNHVVVEKKDTSTVWEKIGFPLFVFQNAAVLEVLHSLFGFVKSPIATTVIQVASRVLLTAVATYIPETQPSIFLSLMVGSWSITEIVRYLFYALNLFDIKPYFLLWLRYSLFLILYPSGVAGELGMLYAAIPFIQKNYGPYVYLWYALMATYAPGLPYMMSHMIKQRSRSLNPRSADDKTKSKKRE